MTSLRDKMIAKQFPVIERIAGRAVTYRRMSADDPAEAAIKATVARIDTDLETEEDYSLTTNERQWLITVGTFEDAFGAGQRPKPGHVIEDGETKWELVRPSDGDVWSYGDPGSTVMRINTIRTEGAEQT